MRIENCTNFTGFITPKLGSSAATLQPVWGKAPWWKVNSEPTVGGVARLP